MQLTAVRVIVTTVSVTVINYSCRVITRAPFDIHDASRRDVISACPQLLLLLLLLLLANYSSQLIDGRLTTPQMKTRKTTGSFLLQ